MGLSIFKRWREINIDELFIGISVFVSSFTFFKTPFEGYLHYLIFLIYLPFFIKRFGFQSFPVKLVLIPVVAGIYNLAVGNCTAFSFFKIFIGIFLSSTFFYYVLLYYEWNFSKLFQIYSKGIIICCYIGLLQVISYQVGFTPGYNYSFILNKWGVITGSLWGLRVNSIFSEPSQFALMLLPAVFIACRNFLLREFEILTLRQSILILISLILTTSSTGFLGIFFSLIIILINFRQFMNFVLLSLLAVFGFIALYNYIPDFKIRVDTSFNLWVKGEYSLEDINSSSFVLYNNFHVAASNLKAHPLLGSGLGSYPEAYSAFSLTKAEDFIIKKGFDFNSQDGNSLFIRSMAELGLIGIFFWFLLIPRFFVKRDPIDPSNITWVYSGAFLTLILGYLIRQGNYFINGFPFFVMMYCFIGAGKKAGLVLRSSKPITDGN